ncbi:MAG TPA: hypothetical protein VF950_09060 [Planctomycetota bacterium]
MRTRTLLVLAALGASGCGRADEGGPPVEQRFFGFKPGSKWTYDFQSSLGRRVAVFTLAKQKPGRTYWEYDLFNPPDPGATASLDEIWYLDGGHVAWSIGDDEFETIKPMWFVYKLGSKKGDSWPGPGGRGNAVHLGFEDVVVPAGRYADVLHIRLTDEDAKTHDFYFAPSAGMVKWSTTGAGTQANLELARFE